MRRSLSSGVLGLLAAAGLAAACSDPGPSACFEPDVQAYATHIPGDTSLTFNWPASYMPVRVYAEPVGSLQADVDAALALWNGAFRCGEATFSRVADSATADIVVRNPAQLPPPPVPVRALHADSVNACRGRTDLLLSIEGALVRPIRSYVVPNSLVPADVTACYHFVTAHELGHAVGLFSHSADTLDLMHAVPRRRALSDADRYTIQQLYHRTVGILPEPR